MIRAEKDRIGRRVDYLKIEQLDETFEAVVDIEGEAAERNVDDRGLVCLRGAGTSCTCEYALAGACTESCRHRQKSEVVLCVAIGWIVC